VPLSPNKTAAQAMLAEIVKRVEEEKAGIVDSFTAHRRRPLAEHLADFTAFLAQRGAGAKQVKLKTGRIRRVLAAAASQSVGGSYRCRLNRKQGAKCLGDRGGRRQDNAPARPGTKDLYS
jgi:hypothetical protein